MYRESILNFFAANFKVLSSIEFVEGSIILFGADNQNQEFSKLLNPEQLFIYNFKLPRIYKKVRSLDTLKANLLDFSTNIDNLTILKTNEFDNSFTDPYSEISINKSKCNYLYLIPIIKNNLHVGLMMLYANLFDNEFLLSSGSLTKLYVELASEEACELSASVKKIIGDRDNLVSLIVKDQYAYVSKNLINKYHLNRQVLELSNEIIKGIINNKFVIKTKLNFDHEAYDFYYLSEETAPTYEAMFLSPMELNKLSSEEFTLIFFTLKEEELIDKTKILKIFNLKQGMIYSYDHLFVLKISSTIDKEVLRKIKQKYLSYLLVVDSNTINNKMDLAKIFDYVYNQKPLEFTINNYKEYLRIVGLEKIDNSKINNIQKVVVNNNNQTLIFNEEIMDSDKLFSSLSRYAKMMNLDLFVKMNLDNLTSKELPIVFDEFKEKKINLSIILSLNDNYMPQANNYYLANLLNYDYDYYVDESIILNYKAYELLDQARGVYLSQEASASLNSANGSLLSMMIKYFIGLNKTIIIDDKISDELVKLGVLYTKERN